MICKYCELDDEILVIAGVCDFCREEEESPEGLFEYEFDRDKIDL